MAGRDQLWEEIMCVEVAEGNRGQKKILDLGRAALDNREDLQQQWDFISLRVMYEGVTEKFIQNEDLEADLLDTGRRPLAEATRHRRWGIGLSFSDPKAKYIRNWRGNNLLGVCLMALRNILS